MGIKEQHDRVILPGVIWGEAVGVCSAEETAREAPAGSVLTVTVEFFAMVVTRRSLHSLSTSIARKSSSLSHKSIVTGGGE